MRDFIFQSDCTNLLLEDIVLATKYSYNFNISETEIRILSKVYCQVIPYIFNQDKILCLPSFLSQIAVCNYQGLKPGSMFGQ